MRIPRSLIAAVAVASVAVAVGLPHPSRQAAAVAVTRTDAGAPVTTPLRSADGRVSLVGSVNFAQLAAHPQASTALHYSIQREHEKLSGIDSLARPQMVIGGATSPASTVTSGGGGGSGLNAVNILEMEKAGTGTYSGTNGGLEPPDQAMCVGNGYVMEGVNTAWKVFKDNGAPLTPAVPITQFFKINPAGQAGPSSFVSDPRCVYDASTKRFYALTLEADEANGLTQIPFLQAHTYFAVSKTGDPSGDWYIYNIDITNLTHPTCPCIDDQPLMGFDSYGLYLSANEYSDAEVFPVPVPGQVYTLIGALPEFRNGQAQVYALNKAALLTGTLPALQSFDTISFPVPAADQNKTPISTWSSLQPSFTPPNDTTVEPAAGVEYLMSQLDFQGLGDNRVAVWALTNTASLATASPSLTLKNTVVTTLDPVNDTYALPSTGGSTGVDQKDGPHPLADGCGASLEQVNANDDRMNQVMLTSGTLWAGLNTAMPATVAGKARAGIMYFNIRPGLDGSGNVTATMVRDGYVQVTGNSVLFPSIAASPQGPVSMFFTVVGPDYFPSAGFARLDGVGAGAAPAIHISGPGVAPEDGFTGYDTQCQFAAPATSTTPGVARWGDYSASAVDENGCMWGAAEYIPDEARDPAAGDWGTFITRVQPGNCVEPALSTAPASGTSAPKLNINPCGPAFTDPAGDDQLNAVAAPVPGTQGQNPQMDIIAGNLTLSPDGKSVVTTITLNNLATNLPSGGQGNNYYMYFQFGGTSYYTLGSVDATGAVTYTDGTVSGGARTARTGAADTGSYVPGKNGTVSVNVPVSAVQNIHQGNLVLGPNAETREVEGAVVLQYDVAGPTYDVLLGAVCAKAVTTGSAPTGAPTSAAAPVVSIPNTSAAPTPDGRALALAVVAGLGVVAVIGRRRRSQG